MFASIVFYCVWGRGVYVLVYKVRALSCINYVFSLYMCMPIWIFACTCALLNRHLLNTNDNEP